MTNIAAIRWLTQGPRKPPLIQYMLLDQQLEYLIYPKQIIVSNLKLDLYKIFNHIEEFSKHSSLKVRYKSITKSYGGHRRDSGKFHLLINRILQRKHLLESNSRTVSLLKKEQLAFFKNALYLLDIDCKTRGNTFVAHLWAIALKVTKKQVSSVVKKIWKTCQGIKRMNKHSTVKFAEFYAHINFYSKHPPGTYFC
ncbi:hypothetical protein [Legionella hackeliae]|uniref:Uncharacterized protein n=1 Tax=Legionella hackeliae TaxID=449 RepID=A0A0A8UQA7_LEGHA|nr:hypothetical protein [Legionella hackeliae]KTD10182.1 hypothetical protein Lhac_2550 [Legionella hackeliae]CEK09676.1 conserved protein of unknown function [Legionella hackeliae]STX49587.1 Uncharacterised protein [Legionella hackeliae]